MERQTEKMLSLDPNEDTDTDGDGIGNSADTDDDNDGVSDIDRVTMNEPLNPDTDGDGKAMATNAIEAPIH